jgi:hypothetical protein
LRNFGPAGAVPSARLSARSALHATDNAVSNWTLLTGTHDAKWHGRLARLKDFATSVSRVELGVISVLRISIEATTDRRKFKLAGRNERAKML